MASEIRQRGHMSDRQLLELERTERADRDTHTARIWDQAQFAFETWRGWTSFNGPRRWNQLSGMERVIWHDMIVRLYLGNPANHE